MANQLKVALLGICLLIGFSGCVQAYQQQSAADPDLAQIMRNVQSLLAQQDIEEAERLLKQATIDFSDKPGPWFYLGYVLHMQKQYDRALEAYERAKQFPQTKATTLYNIACIHSLKNDSDQAFEFLNAAIQAGFTNYGQIKNDADLENIKLDPRFDALFPKMLSDENLFVEPTRIIHKWDGEAAGDQFGWTARKAGDMDGDGKIDFITTAPTHSNGAGKIYIYSSASGKLIYEVTGAPGERLGNSAVGLGDVDGDQVPDFAAGAPGSQRTGQAYIYSGKDGKQIHAFPGENAGDQFGYEVSEIGDFDNDGRADLLVGAMSASTKKLSKCGRVYIYSGKTGELLFTLDGERTGDGFGNAASAAQISEGEFLLAVGAQNAGPAKRGRVYVYRVSNAKPTLAFTIDGDRNSVNLGQMFIAFPGDLNRDGVVDVYASDFSDNTKIRGGGKVVVHCGATGEQLLAIFGEHGGEGLGTSPSDAGDVDGDGIGDLVIGAWQNREAAQSGGKVYLYSCADGGRLLRTWTCKQAGDTLGFDATGIGDIDGDGHVDFLLTSAWSNVLGPKTGRVFIVAGGDYSD